jgi:predicted dehydrogenase
VFSTQRIYPYIGAAGARLAGVCDLDRQKAERNARLFGGRTYTSYQQMVRTEEPDGVIVCVGARQHPELAMQLMEMNVPVYTEKPPSLDAAAALEVARKSGSKGVLCTTAFKKRYNLAYSRAREWINGFPQDDLYSLSIDFASAPYTNTFDQDSFILDFGIHAIDLVGWLFGDVSQVFAFAKSPAAYAVCLEFPHGAVGTMNLNDGHSFAHPTEEVEISVKGGEFHAGAQLLMLENRGGRKGSGVARAAHLCIRGRQRPRYGASGRDHGFHSGDSRGEEDKIRHLFEL